MSRASSHTVPRISAAELAAALASARAPLVLDVRPQDQRAIARLPGDRWIPLSDLPARASELPPETPIVVYCHFGGSSLGAVEALRAAGRSRVAVLEGGIDEYSRAVDPTIPRYSDSPTGNLVLQQFPNLATGCLAYLLRDRSGEEAVIVDPGHDVRGYLRAISDQGLRLRAIVETHTHADHLSGHAELHARTDAPIWLGRRSPARYPHRVLEEGEAIECGNAEIVVLETPGHTVDHISLRSEGLVFTGDTLLPGSCGRTDLGGGDPNLLWESLFEKLLRLEDETEVLPAHYGPLHGLPPPYRYSTTVRFERATNEALAQTTREAFVAYMTDGWPPCPPEFERIVSANLGG